MKEKEKRIDYSNGIPFWSGLIDSLPSLIFALAILFIVAVIGLAVIKWAFQIVF